MTIQSNIIINGEQVTDVKTCKVTNSLGNEQSNSDIEFSLLNPYGRFGSKYNAGQTADVYIENVQYKLMPENLKSGLIGYWALEDKNEWAALLGVMIAGSLSPVKDSVGNYQDGSNNSAFRNASAFINAGLNFNGTYNPQVRFLVNPSDPKQCPPSWTISFWNRYVDKAISGDCVPLNAIQTDDTDSFYFYKSFNFYTTSDKSRIWLTINAAGDFVASGQLDAANTWHHIVGTHDAGSALTKFFINNTEMGSLYGTAWDGNMGSLFFSDPGFGVIAGSTYTLDEIAIWNKALTNAEIGSIYNNGSGLSYGNKIFSGRIEDVTHEGEENTETIHLGGRDWGGIILDKTVQPEVYTNLPAGSIVRDIMNKYADEINIQEVGSGGTVIDRIAFNQIPVFDAIKQLADYGDQTFYVDETKKLRFRDKNSISSQRTYDTETSSNNILKSEFKERRDTMYNQVWVYGDRYLDGYQEKFTQTAGLGSVFTLSYNPHNTDITVNGSSWQPGAVYGMTNYPVSGIRYLVDYDSKKIIFSSGTTTGDYIPKNGSVIIVNYQRSLPVVKVGDNESSKAKYGVRSKVIQDKSITDPATAEMIMLKELDNYSDPLKQGTLYIKGIDDIKVGETALLNIPHQGISGTRYEANEIQYTLDDETMNTEHIMRIKFNKHLPDITDQLRSMMMNLRRIQASDMSASDLITRYQYNTGSIGLKQNGTVVYLRDTGSLGNFTIGGNTATLAGIYQVGNWKVFPIGGSLNSMSSYINDLTAGDQYLQHAIYQYFPGSKLLGVTGSVLMNGADPPQWYKNTFNPPLGLIPGSYILAHLNSVGDYQYYYDIAGTGSLYAYFFASTFPITNQYWPGGSFAFTLERNVSILGSSTFRIGWSGNYN